MALIGLSKPYFAKYTNTAGVVSYSNGGSMGKAVSINIVTNTNDNHFYADNGIAETDRSFSSGSISISTDDLSQAVSKAILGATENSLSSITGITDTDATELVFDDNQATPYLGVGVIEKHKKDGAYLWRAVVLHKVSFNVPADSATTQGETIDWQTPTIEGTFMRSDAATHPWKSVATFTTEAQAEVYIKHILSIT